MAACRAGDTLVVIKLDRLARSLPDARDIVAELTACEVKLSLGGSVPRPDRPGRAAVVQRSGHGRRVLCYLDTPSRRHSGREGCRLIHWRRRGRPVCGWSRNVMAE
jgi:hypothetical protein